MATKHLLYTVNVMSAQHQLADIDLRSALYDSLPDIQ